MIFVEYQKSWNRFLTSQGNYFEGVDVKILINKFLFFNRGIVPGTL